MVTSRTHSAVILEQGRPKQEKIVVAVHTQTFLTVSMTFIYRQICGISDRFQPIVLAARVDHEELFPFAPIFVTADYSNLIHRIFLRIRRQLANQYVTPNRSQVAIWSDVLNRQNVELIHAHFGPSGLKILPIAQKMQIPLVTTFHGYDASRSLKSEVYRRNLHQLFEYSHIICVSQYMAAILQQYGLDKSKTYVHYIGIPVDDFHFVVREPIADKIKQKARLSFLQIANFVEKKGHEYTLRAFHRFLPSYPNSQLLLAGDGPTRSHIVSLCEDLGLTNQVCFLGKIAKPEVIELMRSADVFLHHSVTAKDGDMEGIPTVLMEAMATGLTVVSTYHSGIPELIEDGVDGYLISERDVAAYAEQLISLVQGHQPEIGIRASKKIHEKFNLHVQNDKLKDIYEEIINGN